MGKNQEKDGFVACRNSLHSAKAEIFIFGKPKNWKTDFKNHLELIQILEEKGIDRVYIPDTSRFNGLLCESFDFCESIRVSSLKIMSGCKAEGLVIPKGSASVFYSADCPTIVYHDIANDLLIAAHAGLRSLIDKQKVIIDVASRSFESVIDSIILKKKETDHFEIFVVCGIGPGSFIYDINDPIYAETNQKIFHYLYSKYGNDAVPRGVNNGNISLRGIIKSQFEHYGIDMSHIYFDDIDTYYDSDKFWSHHYSSLLKEEKECGRNCILVIHK